MHHHEHNNPDVNASNRFANDAVQETTTPNGSNGERLTLHSILAYSNVVHILVNFPSVSTIMLYRTVFDYIQYLMLN